ncbi:MAG: transglutaminase domain-containing protein [Bacilli bacterium]|nr:transglutaminase domain-containing protein [Bacilli bacterium]MDD4411579.1 transglutaminase domain-containing protein [Bacilli bacterium]
MIDNVIKRIISLIIIFIGLYYIYDNDFFCSQQFVRDIQKKVYLPTTNEYVKEGVDNTFVKMTIDFVPDNKQEILNIYYTAVNSGWDEFTFYCNYEECMNDVNEISNNATLLSNINSFVNPYNQYTTIRTYTTPLLNQKINIHIARAYDKYVTEKLNTKVDEIYTALDDSQSISSMSTKDQIRAIHDYIINNTKYDALKINNINDNTYHSSTAYGPLFEGYAVCNGYADAMALFLNKLNIPNSKVASEEHVWNLVYLDNKWYHLDLTWDDPYIPNSDKDILNHQFFLIDHETLKNQDTEEHLFDKTIYIDAL